MINASKCDGGSRIESYVIEWEKQELELEKVK
jgi:hypothetical protein